MADAATTTAAPSDSKARETRSRMDADTWLRWNAELDLATKVKGYNVWVQRGDKIERRYRDDRGDRPADYQDSEPVDVKFNILWSNIQTLKPALLARPPKPVVERRYLDRDEIGRTASVLLERCLKYEIDTGTFYDTLSQAVMDRLLPGRGVAWVRYDPVIGAQPRARRATSATDQPNDNPDDTAAEKLAESVPCDHINWKDFRHSPARIWREVRWVAKRVYLTRGQMRARGWKDADRVPLTWSPEEQNRPGTTGAITDTVPGSDEWRKAEVWEIWDKPNREVIWWCKAWTERPLAVMPDFLKLEDFFPIPKPLYATMTNNSLVPVPDYYEYHDQACELDELTGRIAALTKAIKVAGVGDGRYPELERLLEEGFENRLVLTEQWSELAQGGGLEGSMTMLPVKEWMEVLNGLYVAREQVKQVLYEVTGISDIVRGMATGQGAKTATEQRIKGQFASMRLNEMQKQVAEFARDTLRIMGEIIAEHYDPETIYQISGYEQYAKEQWLEMPAPPVPQGPSGVGPAPSFGHNGGPPLDNVVPFPGPQGPPPPQPMPPLALPGAAMGAGAAPPVGAPPQPMMMPQLPPGMPAPMQRPWQEKAAQVFAEAIKLLKSDKLRGFRIDIEVDSLIEPDEQETQRARVELLGAIAQFLPQAIQAAAADPKLKPLMGNLLLYFLRGFKAGRDLEGPFEQFIDSAEKEAKNPPPKPPNPEEIKAQAEIQKQQMETRRMEQQAGLDAQAQQREMEFKERESAMKLREQEVELGFKEREMQMRERELMMEAQAKERESEIERGRMEFEAQCAATTHANEMERAQREDERARREDEFRTREFEQKTADREHETQSHERRSRADVEGAGAMAPIVEKLASVIEKQSGPATIRKQEDGSWKRE